MIASGMTVARLNFSHGTQEEHAKTIQLVREAVSTFAPYTVPVAIALDTKGPEIRTGLVNGKETGSVTLVKGNKIKVVTNDKYFKKCDENVLWVDYKNISQILVVDNRIFIDDGLICLVVEEKGLTMELDNN